MADIPQEDIDFFKSKGIDITGIQPAEQEMSQGKAIESTLKAHAGGIAGGGLGTLGGVALASWALGPEAGIPVTLAAIAGGLAGSYGGQKAQESLLSPDTEQKIQEEGQQAEQQHPWTTLGTDVIASALASGGRPGIGSLGKMAAQAGINTGIDVGTSLATGQGLPSGRNIIGDVAGGALFSEPSFLGRMAHGGEVPTHTDYRSETPRLPEPTPEQPAINQPLKLVPIQPIGEQSPSGESETGLQPKSQDTVTVNKQENTTVTPNPIDKKSQTPGPSGLTQEEENEMMGKTGEELINSGKSYRVTVQKGQVPGDKGYVQVDEFQDGKNIRSTNPEDLQKEGFPIPSTEEVQNTMEQGQYPLGDVIRKQLEALTPKEEPQNTYYSAGDSTRNGVKYVSETPEMANQYVEGGKYGRQGAKFNQYSGNINIFDATKASPELLQKILGKNNLNGIEPDGHLNFDYFERDPSIQQRLKDAGYDAIRISEGRENGTSVAILPHAIDKLSLQKGKENAIQEPSPTKVLPREQTETRETGSERGGVGPSDQGKETPIKDNKAGTEQTPPIKGPDVEVNKSKEQPATDAEPEYHPYRAGTWAVADKVHDLPHPGGAPLADAAKQTLNERDRLTGQWKNPIVEAGTKLSAKDKSSLQKVMDTELSKQAEQPLMVAQLSKKAQEFYRLAKQKLSDNADYRLQSNEPVYQGNLPRALKKTPWYWPGMPNQKVEQVYRNNTDTAEIARLNKVYNDWNVNKMGMTPQESNAVIRDFAKAVQGNRSSSETSHQDYFNASRRAMGRPLPPEFREPDMVKNLARYFDRQAIDNAHYRFMEKNPKAMAALGETKDAWGKPINFSYKEGSIAANPQVRALTRQFRPDIESEGERAEGSLSGLVTSALIAGPQLEAHKLISNQVKAVSLADNPYQLSRALGYAVTHIKEGWQHAKEGGVVKLTANSSLDMFNGTMTAAQRMNGLAKGIRDISTLGGITTKLNAGLLQSYFEYLVPSKIIRANAGDVTAQRFIRRLDPTYKPGKIYQSPEVQQLSSTAAQYVHGTADIRTMPAWMMNDSELSGFLSLAHWSVAQTSNFQHDIWEPAKRGNYTPLLSGVFGATIGGYLIKQIREELSGKKGGIPSLQEIASSDRGISGNLGPLAYNAIAAMQYSGFGGLLSQVAKYPFDFVYKNIPQGATFPLDQIATDMVGTIKNVSSAIANDPNLNWVDLAKAVTGHILSTDLQLSRIAINQGINHGLISGLPAEKKLLADKMAQLRRFDMVEGLPYNDIDTSDNPYMNIEQQRFKHDQDVPEAAQMLPGMIQNIIQRYGQQPDVMMSKIKALKENTESFFPSLESTPMQFFKYLNYLGRVEGPEAAQNALQDYMTRKIKNQVKSSIVP